MNVADHQTLSPTGTPAEKMLSILCDLMEGTLPSITDILSIHAALIDNLDVYAPVNVSDQILHSSGLDVSCRTCLHFFVWKDPCVEEWI